MGGNLKIDRTEALRLERDCFVALAFCAADMLLETDGTQAIAFAAGATKALTGRAPQDLAGVLLRDFIAPSDRMFLDELVRGMRPGARLGPVTAHVAGPEDATAPFSRPWPGCAATCASR